MHRNRISKQITFLFLIIVLLLQVTPVYAQGGNSITGQGTIENPTGGGSIAFSLTFNPAGGPVSGETAAINMPYTMGFGVEGFSTTTFVNYPACPITGNFAGGNGGAIQATVTCSGTFSQTINTPVGSGTVKGAMTWTATVNGTLNANGTGSGSADMTSSGTTEPFVMNGIQFPGSSSPASSYSTTWQVAYPAAEFQAGLIPLTPEYFQQTYGITVENGDAEWKDEELRAMDELFRQLPQSFLDQLALTKIVRYQSAWDKNWNLNRSTRADYSAADQRLCPTCALSSETIRIYDSVFDPAKSQFENDPQGLTQFKGTLVHEMTHALQFFKEPQSMYKSAYKNPIVQNWINTTKPVQADPKTGWIFGYYQKEFDENGQEKKDANGYVIWKHVSKWKYWGATDGNRPVTSYASTNPLEDMCDSVKMYLYDPQKLMNNSMVRYQFVRDNIFGGVEYENGQQKKP